MSPAQHRPTRLESIVGIALVAVAAVILIVILASQRRTDISRFGMQPPITDTPQGKSTFDLAQLAPHGFKSFGPSESYNPETLYEKIDGKAPLYTESGFVKLSTQRYINEKNQELTFELYLYDMGTVENAFSVYSIQRRSESSPVDDMNFAYRTDNALYLAHGRYYCEFIGSSDSPLVLDALDFLATGIVENLKDAGPTEIPGLAFFATDHLIADTLMLYLNGAFGFDGLTDTFSAKYRVNDETVTAFITKQFDPAAAKRLLDRYYKFLIDNGAAEISSGDADVKYVDFYGSFELIAAVGPFLYGIHQAADLPAAETTLAIVREKLTKENQ